MIKRVQNDSYLFAFQYVTQPMLVRYFGVSTISLYAYRENKKKMKRKKKEIGTTIPKLVKHTLFIFPDELEQATHAHEGLLGCEKTTWFKWDITSSRSHFSYPLIPLAVSTHSSSALQSEVLLLSDTQQACPVPRGFWIHPINMQTMTQCEPVISKNIWQLWSSSLALWLQWFKVFWIYILVQSLEL